MERAEALNVLKRVAKELRAAGVDFILVTNIGDEDGRHNISADINAQDDHHLLDMLHCVYSGWRKSSH